MIINTNMVYDVAVIGLGPSGMMAVWNLKNNGKKVIGFDRGKSYEQRVQMNPSDVANGFGGAGLFSDGKLSFYPAATKLWERMNPDILRESYSILESLFMKYDYVIPKWDESWTTSEYIVHDHTKINTVQYLDTPTCVNFVKCVYEDIKDNVLLEKEVVKIRCLEPSLFYVYYDDNNTYIKAHSVVLATGKLGNSIIQKMDNVDFLTKFRAEGGIRVETDNCNFLPFYLKQLDYKYIEKLPNGTEFRTFCCCKDGKVLESEYFPKKSYNGTVTESPTGRSNVGLTIRSEDRESTLSKNLMKFFENKTFLFPLEENRNISGFGEDIDYIINNRIYCVIENKEHHTDIYGPEIEYCGEYPIFDWKTLKVDGFPIWIVGDLSAEYRGIIASLISGIYASLIISKKEII